MISLHKVTIYTKDTCPYCQMAKDLFLQYNVDIEEINLENNLEEFAKLCKKTKMRTVPQIFIGEELVGGFDQLNELHQAGDLIKKLQL